MNWLSPEYQAWMQTVRQQNDLYDQKIQQDMQGATYQQALNYPRQYGYGPMANALTQRANNPSTGLFSPTNPFNFYMAQYMANAPGGNTIGLPGGDASDQSNQLVAGLLNRTGVG